jgi:hypothetical protein
MLFKFGDVERRQLRLYRDAPPQDVKGCVTGVEYLEKCMDRLCLLGNDDTCSLDEDMHLLIEALKTLKACNQRLEVLAQQLYKLHPSLLKPLVGQLY